jgi:hypothetical protein
MVNSAILAAPLTRTYWRGRLAAFSAAYVVAVLLLDVLSKDIERMNGVAAFFPADGLALACLYVLGLELTPVVFLAYSLSSCFLFGVDWHVAIGASVIGTALQAGGVVLFVRVLGGDLARGRIADLGRFLLMVGLLALSGGILLRLTLVASGDLAPSQANTAFFTMSTGLATGMLMIASPGALAAGRIRAWLAGGPWSALWPDWHGADARSLAIDVLILLGSTGLTVVVAFAPATREVEPLYVCFVPIIWLALRRGLAGAAVAILLVDVAVIVAFRVQRLPPPELDKIQLLQLALSLTGLILGTVVTEREAAQRAAYGAEVLRHELELARRLQTEALPRVVSLPGFQVAGTMVPASQVGGDFYDILRGPGSDPHFWLLVGDVSGHGLEAGLIVLMAQAAAQATLRAAPTVGPKQLVARINEVLHENIRKRMSRDDFMTLMAMRHDGAGCFRFAGGHLPVFIARRDGSVTSIDHGGPWCGVVPAIEHQLVEHEVRLGEGDLLCLITDGITEARGRDGQLFGEERLLEELRATVSLAPDEALSRLLDKIRAFAATQEDDMTAILLKRTSAESA